MTWAERALARLCALDDEDVAVVARLTMLGLGIVLGVVLTLVVGWGV